MSYSDFNLQTVKQQFNLKLHEKPHFFESIAPVAVSQTFQDSLDSNVILALASNTEKARSELLITPILVELRQFLKNQVTFFSGISFNVDPDQGLNGNCDYIISHSTDLLMLTAPIITLVEAKKEDLNLGLGQCLAEMVAAQIFNQQHGHSIKKIYGVITSGTNWRFLELINQDVYIDLSEYYIQNLEKIFGILINFLSSPQFI